MKKMERRDFLKTSGMILGAAALGGLPKVAKGAGSKTSVAIVKSEDPNIGHTAKHSIWPCFAATAEQAKKEIMTAAISWSKESEAEIERMVRKAVKLAGGLPVKPGDRVLLKPNLVQPPHIPMFYIGMTEEGIQALDTDARVVRALAMLCKEAGAKKVIIGEGNADRATWITYTETGYDKMVEDLKDPSISLLCFEDIGWKWYQSPKALALGKYALTEVLDDIDVLVSVSCLKTHLWAGNTMTMKNLIGLPAGDVYGYYKCGLPHSDIAKVIVDLTAIVKDKVRSTFGVVDAIWGGEGLGPISATPLEMDIVIAGEDMVAVDTVGTVVMGMNPLDLGYLRLAQEMGIGTVRGIEAVGNPIKEVQKAFEQVPRKNRQTGGLIRNWTSRIGQELPT